MPVVLPIALNLKVGFGEDKGCITPELVTFGCSTQIMGVVLLDSFYRNFFRNAHAIGLRYLPNGTGLYEVAVGRGLSLGLSSVVDCCLLSKCNT